jgi:hypothetical protein
MLRGAVLVNGRFGADSSTIWDCIQLSLLARKLEEVISAARAYGEAFT